MTAEQLRLENCLTIIVNEEADDFFIDSLQKREFKELDKITVSEGYTTREYFIDIIDTPTYLESVSINAKVPLKAFIAVSDNLVRQAIRQRLARAQNMLLKAPALSKRAAELLEFSRIHSPHTTLIPRITDYEMIEYAFMLNIDRKKETISIISLKDKYIDNYRNTCKIIRTVKPGIKVSITGFIFDSDDVPNNISIKHIEVDEFIKYSSAPFIEALFNLVSEYLLSDEVINIKNLLSKMEYIYYTCISLKAK